MNYEQGGIVRQINHKISFSILLQILTFLVQNDQRLLLSCVDTFSHLQNRQEHQERILLLLHPPPITTQWHLLHLWCTRSHQVRWLRVCVLIVYWQHTCCFLCVRSFLSLELCFSFRLARVMHLVMWKNSEVLPGKLWKYILELKKKRPLAKVSSVAA